jgi:hypothetical protein
MQRNECAATIISYVRLCKKYLAWGSAMLSHPCKVGSSDAGVHSLEFCLGQRTLEGLMPWQHTVYWPCGKCGCNLQPGS